MQVAERNFQVLKEGRGDALLSWLENTQKDVISLGSDPSVIAATNGFNSSYSLLIDSAGLRDAYITKNPHQLGEKDLYDQAPEAVPYHFQHGNHHPFFREIKNTNGYYDMFLFSMNGDLMYSVYKEADFATNFVSGTYRESALAKAFVAARDAAPGQIFFEDFAAYAPSDGAPASFLATPVFNADDTAIGVLAVQVPASQIDATVNNPIGLGQTGQLYVVGPDMKMRSTSRFENGPTILSDVSGLAQVRASLNAQPSAIFESIGIMGETVYTVASQLDMSGHQWGIIAEMDIAEVNAPAIAARNKMTVVTALVAALSVLLGWLTARSVVRPLGNLGNAMQQVADRNYEIELNEQHRGDEIGHLSRALINFRDKLRASDAAETERQSQQAEQTKVVAQLSTALTRLADGDLTQMIKTPFTGEYDQLRQDYNRTIENLNETIGSVVTRASGIRKKSDDMSASSDDLSRRTENQAATLEQTAAALDELTASVRSAANGAREVEEIVGNARKDAQESEPVVKNAVHAMTEIETSSEQISQIIGVIDDIAFQTNLLALNAGVEAARAGEAGRGFAVVASEVRALAQRSSDAAKQIKTLISESSGQVARGVSLVGQAGEVLTKISDHINHISGLVGEIASGAAEQSTGLGEINIGVTQLDKVTQQNAAMVEQATASSHALNGDAGELSELVRRFKLMVDAGQVGSIGANVMAFSPQRSAHSHDTLVSSVHSQTDAVAVAGGRRQAAQGKGDMWEDF